MIYNFVNIIPKFLLMKSPILDFGIPMIDEHNYDNNYDN